MRSIGEYGIGVIAIVIIGEYRLTSYSKYIDSLYMVGSLDEGYNLLLKEYGNESVMPFVFTCDDSTESLLDNNYNDLKSRFIFFNAGSQGKITMNLPILWVIATLEGRINESWKSDIPIGFTSMVEIDDLHRHVKTGQIGLIKWYKEFKDANCKFIYNKCDKKPFRSELMSILKRKLRI